MTNSALDLIDIALRGGCLAVLILAGGLLLRHKPPHQTLRIAFAFVARLASYMICSSPVFPTLPGALRGLILIGCLANPVLFWLLARSIFEDHFKLRLWHGAMLAAIVCAGWLHVHVFSPVGTSAPESIVFSMLNVALRVISILFVLAALFSAFSGRAMDLVSPRRKFRDAFILSTGAYMLVIAVIEVVLAGHPPHPIISIFNAVAILLMALYTTISLAALKGDLLIAAVPQRTRVGALDLTEQALLARLNEALATGIYRRPDLTIPALAAALNTQEHRLRALINQRLGFRNFSDFLNRYRIADACAELAQPAAAATPVLTIALGLGYGSIGPFNRAFKASTGQTPTEYRRQKLADAAKVAPAVTGGAN